MIQPELQGVVTASGLPQDRLLSALFESSADAIIVNTLDGTIRAWNNGAMDMYGYSAADAVGQPISMLCPPDRKSEINDLLGRIAQGQRIAQHETVQQHKNGDVFPISVSISPVYGPAGRIVGASSIARGFSAQQLQAAQSQARLASVVESSRDAILTLDLHGDRARRSRSGRGLVRPRFRLHR